VARKKPWIFHNEYLVQHSGELAIERLSPRALDPSLQEYLCRDDQLGEGDAVGEICKVLIQKLQHLGKDALLVVPAAQIALGNLQHSEQVDGMRVLEGLKK
jgi:hypothetical protein